MDKLVVLAFDDMSLAENLTDDQQRDELEGFQDLQTEKSQFLDNLANVFMIRNITQVEATSGLFCNTQYHISTNNEG